MSEGGGLPSEGPVHEEVFGGRDEPLAPSQHVADLHVMIIYDVSEVVGGKTVGLHHHRVPLHLRQGNRGGEITTKVKKW